MLYTLCEDLQYFFISKQQCYITEHALTLRDEEINKLEEHDITVVNGNVNNDHFMWISQKQTRLRVINLPRPINVQI